MPTINQLLQKVRIKLKDQIKNVGVLASAQTNSTTTLKVVDGFKVEEGDYLEIGSEVIRVEEGERLIDYMSHASDIIATTTAISVDTSGNFVANDFFRIDNEYLKVSKVSAIGGSNLKVLRGERGTEAVGHYKKAAIYMKNKARIRRGFLGSSASAHAVSAAIYLADGWTDYELRENIKEGIRQLRPFFYRDWIGRVKGVGNLHQLDDMDATTGWTAFVSGQAVAVDTSDKVEGDASFKMGSKGATTGAYRKAITSFDFTDYEYLNAYIKLAAIEDTDDDPYFDEEAITIRLGSASATSYYQWKLHRNELMQGAWYPITLHRSQASAIGTVTDTAVNNLSFRINAAQAITAGDVKVDNVFVSKYPLTTNKRQYPLPRNVFGINEVVFTSSDGTQKQLATAWRVEGEASQKTLVFDYDPPQGYYMELKGQELVKIPSDNTTEIGLDDTEEEAIVLKAANLSLDSLMNDKLRFDRYSSKLETQRTGVLDIYRAKTQIEQDLNGLINRFGKPLGGTDLDWTDEISNAKNQIFD